MGSHENRRLTIVTKLRHDAFKTVAHFVGHLLAVRSCLKPPKSRFRFTPSELFASFSFSKIRGRSLLYRESMGPKRLYWAHPAVTGEETQGW